MKFAEVALNLSTLRNLYYRIPPYLENKVKPGKRVKISVKEGIRVGFCVGVWDKLLFEPREPLKKIINVVDKEPLLPPALLRLARWMWKHYLCPPASVFTSMLPFGIRRQTKIKKMVKFARLTFDSKKIEALLKSGTLNEKHYRILSTLLKTNFPVELKELARRCAVSLSPIKTLRKKGYIEISSRKPEIDVIPFEEKEKQITLTDEQKNALENILTPFHQNRHEVILLFGVTGCGKTEVYINAAEEVIKNGKQVIVLVPEVALTPVILTRFKRRIPKIAVLHSYMTQADRRNEWLKVKEGEVDLVIGTRSAIFAPTSNTGLIIVDEEHENTYKQDTTPRYLARDVAIKRGEIENAVVVLGSATPSVDSYHHATTGKYKMVRMENRIDNLPMPRIEFVDLASEVPFTKAPAKDWLVSRHLRQLIFEANRKNEQVLLFLNRKGFSSKILCRKCGWISKCKRCDSVMTYYKQDDVVICHYCMQPSSATRICPRCGNVNLQFSGLGTEKIEHFVKKMFPELNITRMDAQSMKTRKDYSVALQSLWDGQIDLLVGTQMIAKGLDVPNVTLVGVVFADIAFNIPDFRSAERTFQLITQVAGRAGRGQKGGLVVVQTFQPDHYSLRYAKEYDYENFYKTELQFREELNYPPFSKLVRIVIEDKEPEAVKDRSSQILELIKPVVEKGYCQVLGPTALPKLKGRFRAHLLLKVKESEETLKELRNIFFIPAKFLPARIIIDVDPINFA
jgi:primosomal protein N' (replication factor Y)